MALLRRKQLRSCSVIATLGDDLLGEILIRLPNTKSAFRCKPVCRRWKSLISSPSFSRRFVSRHRSADEPRTLHLHTDDASGPKSVIMGFVPSMPYRVRDCFKVLDCFKDLVLCGYMDLDKTYTRVRDPDKNYNKLGRTYVVCNPFTKLWMALPLAPEKAVGYEAPVTRLICEPRSSSSNSNSGNLDLDDDQVRRFTSDYRFRVVCIYQHQACIKLDVFCSESGKWTNEALVFPGYRKLGRKNVCSCNGELFWLYGVAQEVEGTLDRDQDARVNPMLAALNPFRLDMPPTCIDASEFAENSQWDISVSQGALHVIELQEVTKPALLRVWRLENDRLSWGKQCLKLSEKTSRCNHDIQSWRKQCEWLLEERSWYVYKLEHCKILDLHPEKPEIAFVRYFAPSGDDDDILCWDLRRGKLDFFTDLRQLVPRWKLFTPRVSCWPTPIPRYEELRGMYDGSCSWFKAAKKNFLGSGSKQQVTAPSTTDVAAIDILRAATETLKNDFTDKMFSVPVSGGKRHGYNAEVLKLDEELVELRSQREKILSR